MQSHQYFLRLSQYTDLKASSSDTADELTLPTSRWAEKPDWEGLCSILTLIPVNQFFPMNPLSQDTLRVLRGKEGVMN